MKLYLQRHAEAEEGERSDPSRSLTEEGQRQIGIMADWLVREIGRVDLVVSSGFVRAVDTARGMGEALGCHEIETTPHLDPDGDPAVAWHDIRRLTKQKADKPDDAHVLVVTHHPLVNKLAEYLCSVKTDDEHFRHAAVMHIHASDPGASVLEYFVPPKVVERDEVADSALEAAEAATAALQSKRSGLHHPKHKSRLDPIRAKAAALFAKYFRRQQRILLKSLDAHLKQIPNPVREADDPDAKKRQALDAISHALPDGYQIPVTLTQGMSIDYSKALSAAIEAGFDVLASDAGSGAELGPDAMGGYLRDNSLAKLTGELDRTSVDRLRDALADAYEAGEDYDGLVETIKEEFQEFATERAQLIAQTEMNDAYNHGRNLLARDLNFNEKSWSADGPNPCPECIGNVLDGWIGIDELFSSGDDLPTAHPNCFCSADFRFNPSL